jgi:MFS family permease
VKKWLRITKLQIIVGIVIFMVSFLVASQAQFFMGLMTAMVILTIGEMLVWPAVPTIAGDLAPKGREGFYQGIVNSTATGGRMFGPIVGGVMVDLSGIHTMFYMIFGLLVISLLITFIYDRKIVPEASSQVA